jgi:hypothetical protein
VPPGRQLLAGADRDSAGSRKARQPPAYLFGFAPRLLAHPANLTSV